MLITGIWCLIAIYYIWSGCYQKKALSQTLGENKITKGFAMLLLWIAIELALIIGLRGN